MIGWSSANHALADGVFRSTLSYERSLTAGPYIWAVPCISIYTGWCRLIEVAVRKSVKSHSPTLDTQLMIERCIREAGSFPSRRALMRALPRQVEYPTLTKILVYLEASNKILLGEDGSIVWVFTDNPKLVQLLAESPVIRSEGTQTSTNISGN